MSTHPAIPLIAQFEGFRSNAYPDYTNGRLTGWRVGYGSGELTKPDGTVVPVQPGMSVTQADAQRDLDRRTAVFQSGIKDAIGEAAWNKLTPGAQAALTSVSYNYGHLPWSVQSAAATGDPSAIARSINGLAGDNNGVNAKRRQTEANAVLGIGAPIGSLGIGGPEGDHPIASASKTPSPTTPTVDPLQGRSLLELALAKANGGKPVEHLLTNGLKALFPAAGDKAEPLTEGRSAYGGSTGQAAIPGGSGGTGPAQPGTQGPWPWSPTPADIEPTASTPRNLGAGYFDPANPPKPPNDRAVTPDQDFGGPPGFHFQPNGDGSTPLFDQLSRLFGG
jgi:GH24 family phage-related lysozyme (muramidase)